MQENLRHDLIPVLLPPSGIKRLLPPGSAEAPFATGLHAADGSKVVALLGCEVEELFGYFGGYGVVAEI